MLEISWLSNKVGSIAQIYSHGLEYCFVNEENKQCHHFVFCKDFLQDVVLANLHNKKVVIYGFAYSTETHPSICLSQSRLALADKDCKDFEEKLGSSLEFVNFFAGKMHIKASKMTKVDNPPTKFVNGVFLVEGSKIWLSAPPLLSLYSLLLRAGLVHKKGECPEKTLEKVINGTGYGREDHNQLRKCKSSLEKMLKIGYRKFFYIDPKKNYPAETKIDTLHNHCGIVGFTQEETHSVVPYWHRKKLQTLLKAG